MIVDVFVLMMRRPPCSTCTVTRVPFTTRVRSPFGVAGFVFLGLLIVMMREDVRHQRRATRAARLAIGDQQRALNLMRDFERAGRGWFWETDRDGRLDRKSTRLNSSH